MYTYLFQVLHKWADSQVRSTRPGVNPILNLMKRWRKERIYELAFPRIHVMYC